MRTIRPSLSSTNQYSDPIHPDAVSDNSTDSVADFRFQELDDEFIISAAAKSLSPDSSNKLLELSQDNSDFCSFNSDVSSELQRLASSLNVKASSADRVKKGTNEIGLGLPPNVTTEILEIVKPLVKLCVEILGSSSAPPEGKRGAVGKLRLLAKNRSDFREIIGESGAIQSLIPFLRSSDPRTQENAVTAVLNLSLEESNKRHITAAGAITPLVYALSAGTAIAKQNAALALLNLSMIEDNQNTIGVCGAIPPLVALLVNGSSRGKKDALTTLYKLCSNPHNKERAVSAGAVTPLVALVADGEDGTAEKAMVVLSVLSEIEAGREAIVEEGGIPALLEAIEDGPATGAEFALITLLQLCSDSECNRGILVKEGAIPPLVALRHSASHRLKHKANALLKYLRRDSPAQKDCALEICTK